MSSKKRKKPRKRARSRQRRRISPLYVLIPIALALLAAGIWQLMPSGGSSGTGELPQFPDWLRALAPNVQQAYTQAVAHREELQYIPCYCGCGGVGHTAVVDCHIAGTTADGGIIFDKHAST